MKKNLLFMKLSVWHHFKRLSVSLVILNILLFCLPGVVCAKTDVSDTYRLDDGYIANDDLARLVRDVSYTRFADNKSNSASVQSGSLSMNAEFVENVLNVQDAKGIKVTSCLQQQKVIKGKVTDALSGEPLPGVNITVLGTITGTVTDMDGNYSIMVPDTGTLVFSFVGYLAENIPIGSNTVLNVQLTPGITMLEETVVIGYQEVHKKRVTAAVASVSSDELEEIPAASISTILAGKAAGVQSLVRSGAPGMSGGGLLIRGNTYVSTDMDLVNGLSSPLYVIDGIPTTLEELAGYDATNTDYLSSLNPQDVESIDILKDASAAAIYGSRGANGVIIIKTKKGRVGEPEFFFNTYSGITAKPELFKVYTGAADRRFKLALIEHELPLYTQWGPYSEARARLMPLELTDSLNPAFNNDYDFQGMFYRQGSVQDYDFGVTGGTQSTNYRLGLGYYNEKGVVIANGYKRYTFNANVRNKFSSRVLNDLTVRGSFVDRETGLGDADPEKTFPLEPINLPASYLYKSQEELDALVGKLNKVYNTNRVLETQLSNFFQADLYKGIMLNSQIGLSYWQNKKNFFGPSVIHENEQSSGLAEQGSRYGVSIETYLTYDKDIFQNHRLNILAGHAITYNQYELLNLTGEDGSSDGIKTIKGYKKENINGYSDVSSNSMLSYWLRVGYAIKERYLFDFNYRREASSRFGKDKRWGNFPAVSAGWIVSDESFWGPLARWITYAKVKASYGINGKQYPDDYLRFNEYTTANIDLWNPNMDVKTYGGITAITPDFNKIANTNLGWEESRQWNIGTEITGFTNRLYITFDAYHKYTDGLVFDINFPAYSGYTSAKANLIDIVNQGWEMSFDAHIFPRNANFQWEWIFNFAHNDNFLTKLPYEGRDFLNKDKNYAYVMGYPLNVPWMYEYVGIVQDVNDLPVNPFTGERVRNEDSYNYSNGAYFPGLALYRDVNGDYIIKRWDDSDYAFITDKTANPKVIGGINTVMKYKKWSLRVNTSFALGHYIFNRTLSSRLDRYSIDANYSFWLNKASYELPYNFWEKPGDNAEYPKFVAGVLDVGSYYEFPPSSLFLEKGDYLKISDITLSYTFDQPFLAKIHVKSIRFYTTASDVYQFQKANVPDASMVDARGYDYGNGYPLSRKFIFGLNAKF